MPDFFQQNGGHLAIMIKCNTGIEGDLQFFIYRVASSVVSEKNQLSVFLFQVSIYFFECFLTFTVWMIQGSRPTVIDRLGGGECCQPASFLDMITSH